MSGGQWGALPQRRRRRGPAAAPIPPAEADAPPHPPQQQQQHEQQRGLAPPQAPAPSLSAPGARAVPGGDSSGDLYDPQHQLSAGSSNNSTVFSGGVASTEDRDEEGRPDPPHWPKQAQWCQTLRAIPAVARLETIDLGCEGAGAREGSVAGDATAGVASTPAATAVLTETNAAASEQPCVAGDGEGCSHKARRDAEVTATRYAAVATAVEARSKMMRFEGGLEGGAGADGGADGGANFEYLDHTADVQLHSWGDSIEQAMEGALAAMFNTITDIAKVDVDSSKTRVLDIEGHDAKSLLYSLLDEFLFLFHSEGLAVKRATVSRAIERGSGPSPLWRLKATAEGETFDLSKHPQGTEVKAITYSNMQINEAPDGRTDIYVIVDI